jgi:AcrR family transcriptional regulator
MFDEIESRFASKARTPKGRRGLQSIFRATRATLAEDGLQDTSLDTIAERAGLSQAALRHYFPTRDDLLQSFFVTTSEWFRAEVEKRLADARIQPRATLASCVTWHLEFMEQVETAFWLEASCYWLRHRPARRTRDDFYVWLTGRYATLIGRITPSLGARERQRRAYLMLTMVLGAWVTHGRGSALDLKVSSPDRRRLLIDTVMKIATS